VGHVACGRKERCIWCFGGETTWKTYALMGGYYLNAYSRSSVWTGLIWLMIGSVGGSGGWGNEPTVSIKCRGIS